MPPEHCRFIWWSQVDLNHSAQRQRFYRPLLVPSRWSDSMVIALRIELSLPAWEADVLANRRCDHLVAGEGIEPFAPLGLGYEPNVTPFHYIPAVEPITGIEPVTGSLQNYCSTCWAKWALYGSHFLLGSTINKPRSVHWELHPDRKAWKACIMLLYHRRNIAIQLSKNSEHCHCSLSWLEMRGSNSHQLVQSEPHYHCANFQNLSRSPGIWTHDLTG